METDDTIRTGARMRTSDAEREQIAVILRAAMTEGRLDLTEGEERLARAYAAVYRDELAPLTADLPDGGRRALRDTPQARSATRRSLIRHANIVVSISMILTGVWILSGAHFFWPVFPIGFLVMGLVRHARWGRWHPRYSYACQMPPGAR